MTACEHENCTSKATRHLMGHYFCNDCNETIRNSAIRAKPDDLQEYAERFI